MMNKYQASGMSYLIDNFFFIGPPNSDKCLQDVLCLENMYTEIGITIKKSKTVFQTKVLLFMGLE